MIRISRKIAMDFCMTLFLLDGRHIEYTNPTSASMCACVLRRRSSITCEISVHTLSMPRRPVAETRPLPETRTAKYTQLVEMLWMHPGCRRSDRRDHKPRCASTLSERGMICRSLWQLGNYKQSGSPLSKLYVILMLRAWFFSRVFFPKWKGT